MTKPLLSLLLTLCLILTGVGLSSGKDDAAKGKTAFTAFLSSDAKGKAAASFATSTPNIYVVWQGYDLKKGDKVRTTWTLEDGGPTINKNVKVFENTQTAEKPGSNGSFNSAKPGTGWTPGKYRADVFVNDAKVESLKFTIK